MKKDFRISSAPVLFTALLTIGLCSHSLGHIATAAHPGNMSATDLLQKYQSTRLSSADAETVLIGVLNKKLPSTGENVRAVRTSLAKARSQGEKVLLIKVLASLYVPGAQSQQNSAIESDIKSAIHSSDQRVGREAVVEYSRLGYPPDRYSVLQQAHSSGLINDDLYYGELAHGLRIAKPAERSGMLTELEVKQNKFASEVLASTFSNPQFINQLSRPEQTRLLKLLSAGEPAFPISVDSFGMVDAIRYSFWINAVSTLDSSLNGKPWSQLVIKRLSDPSTDPRKILAVFSNPEGKRAIAETNDIGSLHVLLGRAQAYSNSLPQNAAVKSATGLFATQLTAGGTDINTQ